MTVSSKSHQGRNREKGGMEEKLNGDYLRLMPGLCLDNKTELIGEFKMAAGDVISIG